MARVISDNERRQLIMVWKKLVGERYFREENKPTEPVKVIDWTIEQIAEALQKASIVSAAMTSDNNGGKGQPS